MISAVGEEHKSANLPLRIQYKPVAALRANPRNARIHSKHQLGQIAESIRRFGFTNPVLVDAEDRILAGHGRVEAAKLIGVADVPTIRLDRLTREQVKAYAIADNKLALNASWDRELLAIELQELLALDIDFDITVTGFEIPEIDLILEEVKHETAAHEVPPEPDLDQQPVTHADDIWILRRHKIVCGNSLYEATYRSLFGSRRAAMVFTDPPYDVPIDGHATGNGATRHREFAMAVGEMISPLRETASSESFRFLST